MVEDKLNSTSSNCMFVLCFGVVSKKKVGKLWLWFMHLFLFGYSLAD